MTAPDPRTHDRRPGRALYRRSRASGWRSWVEAEFRCCDYPVFMIPARLATPPHSFPHRRYFTFRTPASVLVALTSTLAACSGSPRVARWASRARGMGSAPDSGAGETTADAETDTRTPLRNVDVAIIYPLPAASDLDALLKPSDQGLGGALLTAAVFDQGAVPELMPATRWPTMPRAWRRCGWSPFASIPVPRSGERRPPPAGVFRSCVWCTSR